ncbi:MAG: Ger(x)C family spore germination C-terminal domain-containing protein [Candidatus Carbobacillus sp.]|nr:Ger(x)C family spore germination C-terminal domain-containing protein [Candidatus Carbobacillus sp.]
MIMSKHKVFLNNNRWRSLLLVFFVIVWSGLLVTGCAYKDIDKRAFVVSIGVDPAPRNDETDMSDENRDIYDVTLKVAIPTADIKSGENRFVLYSATGQTIADAIHKVTPMIEGELDFSHAKLIFFAKTLAEHVKLSELIDWFVRMETIQDIALVALAEPSAKDVLSLSPPTERLPANSLFTALDGSGTTAPTIVHSPLIDVYRRLYEPGLDPYLSIVQTVGKKNFKIDRVALFDKTRLQLVLDSEDTEWFNFLARSTSNVTFSNVPKGYFFQVDPNRASSHFTLEEMPQGKLTIVWHIDLKGSIDERQGKAVDDKEVIAAQIRKLATQKTQTLTETLLKHHLDPLGFGFQYRIRHPHKNDFATFQNMYPSLETRVHIQTVIYETGNLTR